MLLPLLLLLLLLSNGLVCMQMIVEAETLIILFIFVILDQRCEIDAIRLSFFVSSRTRIISVTNVARTSRAHFFLASVADAHSVLGAHIAIHDD